MAGRVLLLIFAALIAGFSGPAVRSTFADSDTVTPKLVSVSRSSASPISPPGPLSFDFTATDALNVSSVTLVFDAPIGPDIAVRRTSTTPGVQVPASAFRVLEFSSLDQYDYSKMPAGTYTLVEVQVGDWSTPFPNELRCLRNGSAIANPGTSTMPASPCPSSASLQALDFTIENPDEDLTAPRVTSLSLPTGTVEPGDSITLTYTASDGAGAGLSTIGVDWVNASNPSATVSALVNATANGVIQVQIGENVPPGVYKLALITLRDRMQYVQFYAGDGSANVSPAGVTSLETAPHPFLAQFTNDSFTVVNPNADTQAPEVLAFVRESADVLAPLDDLTFDVEMTDNDDVREIQLDFIPPLGQFVLFDLNVTSDIVEQPIDAAAIPGLYTLVSIRIFDQAGNETRYFRGGGITSLPPGVSGPQSQPPGMAAMFEQADFMVGSGPNINLQSLSPTSTPANSGSNVVLTVNGSGFTANSRIFFGSQQLTTTFVSANQLTGVVTPSLLTGSARTVIVTVTTPPGSSFSRALQLSFVITAFSRSDADCDGDVDLGDAVQSRQWLAGLQPPTGCDTQAAGFLDADESGVFDAADPLHILRKLAGLEP